MYISVLLYIIIVLITTKNIIININMKYYKTQKDIYIQQNTSLTFNQKGIRTAPIVTGSRDTKNATVCVCNIIIYIYKYDRDISPKEIKMIKNNHRDSNMQQYNISGGIYPSLSISLGFHWNDNREDLLTGYFCGPYVGDVGAHETITFKCTYEYNTTQSITMYKTNNIRKLYSNKNPTIHIQKNKKQVIHGRCKWAAGLDCTCHGKCACRCAAADDIPNDRMNIVDKIINIITNIEHVIMEIHYILQEILKINKTTILTVRRKEHEIKSKLKTASACENKTFIYKYEHNSIQNITTDSINSIRKRNCSKYRSIYTQKIKKQTVHWKWR